MYRVFGNPHVLATRQAALFLKHKRAPHDLHVTSLLSNRIAAWWYRAPSPFCFTTPAGTTFASVSEFIAHVETETPVPMLIPPPITHPALFAINSLLGAYAQWYLGLTGGMFRWVYNDGSPSSVDKHSSFFIMLPVTLFGLGLNRVARHRMQQDLAHFGVVKDTETYFSDHFLRLVNALEAHFGAGHAYLLGTPFPTLCDVLFAAAFDTHFFQDDATSEWLNEREDGGRESSGAIVTNSKSSATNERRRRRAESLPAADASAGGQSSSTAASPIVVTPRRYANLHRWMACMRDPIGPNGSIDEATRAAGLMSSSGQEGPQTMGGRLTANAVSSAALQQHWLLQRDVIPRTLDAICALALEVLPWLSTQCQAFKLWLSLAGSPTAVVDVATASLRFPGASLLSVREQPPPRHVATGSTMEDAKHQPTPSPSAGLTASGGVSLGDGVERVVGHKVPRLLDQQWVMAVDDSTVPCRVAVPHVALAQRVSGDAAVALPLILDRVRKGGGEVASSEAMPVDRVATILSTVASTADGLENVRIAPTYLHWASPDYAVWTDAFQAK